MSSESVIVIGAGPSGLLQALYLARVRRRPVILVEQQPRIGGMFAAATVPWGSADQGVHLLQETGNPKFDSLFFDILPREAWHVLDGVRKDIAGNYFKGSLDEGSLYPDLRRLPPADHRRCLEEITACAVRPPLGMAEAPHLRAYLSSRFGAQATELVFEPIARKIWRRPLDSVSAWAAKIVHLARVVTHDADAALALKKRSPALDAVIGFPEQLRIPDAMLNNRRKALYPSKAGLWRVVDGLRAALERAGATFVSPASISRMSMDGRRVNSIALRSAGAESIVRAGSVLWTTTTPALMALLGGKAAAAPDPPVPHRIVHLLLDQPPRTGPLYWLWSYDSGNSLVRISNPAAYCPAAATNGRHPICVETHVESASTDDASVLSQVQMELIRSNLIGAGTSVLASAVLPGLRTFPVPTVANCDALDAQKAALKSLLPENVHLSMQDITGGMFYLSDILVASLPMLDSL